MTIMFRTLAATVIALAAILGASEAFAQTSAVTRIRGSFSGSLPDGEVHEVTFSCEGADPCVGTYSARLNFSGCSNDFYVSNTIVISGLNLSAPGSIQGTVRLVGYDIDDRVVGGVCTILSSADIETTFSGTWDGSRATVSLAPLPVEPGIVLVLSGTLRKDGSIPVFPMTVTSRIDGTSATATAAIQYRPQDVGASGSVYVFALAPADLVKGAADGGALKVGKTVSPRGNKADPPVACVLAQLNASGQLQAVTASSLQAYITGVLSAQGQTVQILNGASTVTIGGAIFYVGYGTSAAAMINNGINRNAVTVPGNRVCNPQPPQTGWWWNPAEGGRGFSIEAADNKLFMATYLYDVSGRSTWHVATGPTSIDGSVFNGQLLSFGNGVTLTGAYRANTRLADAGPISLTFDDESHGTLVWPGGTVAIQRFPVNASGPGTPPLANQPESGWWWGGAADNGRGFFIEWQGNRAFLAGYMYDAAGNATWYVADSPVTNAQALQGTWLSFANGQTLTGAYAAPTIVNANVAPVTIQFQGADSGILTLPSGTLSITRFKF